MSKFLNEKYQSLQAYTPGEQPQDKQYIKLNTNESPYPPSQAVINAITSDEVEKLRLYCDPDCKKLKKSIADLYGVDSSNVFVSNGSDDILNFSFMAFASKYCPAVFPEISYGFYKVYANLHNVKYEQIPLNVDFTINYNDYCNKNAFVVIANPNAPTGLTLSIDQIEQIIKSNPNNVVLIDEAYVDFGAESCVTLTKKYKNLLVVQTFSKSRSLAGARLGFAIADSEIIADLERIKYSTNPYNVNRLTQLAGEAAIADNDYYMQNCKQIIKSRDYTVLELKNLGFNVIDSKANFIFAKNDKIGGEQLYLKLKEKGILVRHFNTDSIKEFNRITIGTLEQMRSLISAIKQIMEEQL